MSFAPSGELYVSEGTATNAPGSNVARVTPGYIAVNVSLSNVTADTVTVDYSTINGMAVAGSDYDSTSGTLTFATGVVTQSILIKILDDTTYESTETFTVNLSNPVGGVIADGQGVGTIIDNDLRRPSSTSSTTAVREQDV